MFHTAGPVVPVYTLGPNVVQDTQSCLVQHRPGYGVVVIIANPALCEGNSGNEVKPKSVHRMTPDIPIEQLDVGE